MRRLEAAANLAPTQAALWNDLAVVYVARAEVMSEPHDLILSLAAASRALKLDPRLLAARFNFALLLERFSLRDEAKRQWTLFLQQEHDQAWSHEGNAHLTALNVEQQAWEDIRKHLIQVVSQHDSRTLHALIAANAQHCREYVEEELLISWAQAQQANQRAEAERYLTLARALANGLVDLTGDRMAADTVDQIDRLRLASRLPTIAAGLRSYGAGLALVRRGNFTNALPHLRTAAGVLGAEGIPLSRSAMCQAAYCHYQRYEYPQALTLLLTLARDAEAGKYIALHGRALWIIGLIDLIRGDLTASLSALTAASSDFGRLRESAHRAMLDALVATDLAYLGRRGEAWRVLLPALQAPSTHDAPLIRSAVHAMAEFMALDEHQLDVGLLFQNEMLRSARLTGTTSAVASALLDRAYILEALGDERLALSALQEAADLLPLIPDRRTRRLCEGDILLAKGKLVVSAAPVAAIDLLTRAIVIFAASDYHYELAQAHYQRATAENAVGRTAAVEGDLAGAIAEFERQRSRILIPEQRVAFFDQARAAVDLMVSLQLSRGMAAPALAYSEHARARVLMDWISAQPVPAFAPIQEPSLLGSATRSLQESLPSKGVFVEYWLQRERLVIWIIRPSRVETQEIMVTEAALTELVNKLTRSLAQSNRAEFLKTAEALYEILILPEARFLSPGCRLVFVPDGVLHSLPFALLRDAKTGRYLAQDHPSSVAPSAMSFAACRRRARQVSSSGDQRVLVIANPEFDQELYPTLQRLRGGATEELIAQILPGSRVLHDREATKEAFLANAGAFEIVHFGGHAVVNPEFPLLSQLLFAKDADDFNHGVLYSGEILAQHFAKTRLAVLASCSTAAGQISRTEGVESFARPFLACGVPAVIASLWNVDDTSTAEFFVRFYQNLRQKREIAAALQATQIDSLNHGSERIHDPLSWGAFELIGEGD